MTFKEFMKAVDAELNRVACVGHLDIGDFDYMSAFEDECDPTDVARDALEYNDFPFEYDGET